MYSTAAPIYFKLAEQRKAEITEEALTEMSLEINEFFAGNGRFPDSLEEVFNPVPKDPWGNP